MAKEQDISKYTVMVLLVLTIIISSLATYVSVSRSSEDVESTGTPTASAVLRVVQPTTQDTAASISIIGREIDE